MDSITHLFVGGAIAAALAPASQRRAALLAGAALNSLPDLDVLPLLLSDDPVIRMVWHRGATHSLFLLPLVGWALWAWFRRRGGRVAQAPTRWFWIFQCALLSHPLLDAFTVYGTQLLWPLPLPPMMWSSLFIIDPLFSLCLAVPCVVAWIARERLLAQRALIAGLALALAYLGLSQLAKHRVEREAGRALAQRGLQDAPRFSVPMPFNILLWRVVAMTPDGFVEGERSLVADHGPMRFVAYHSDAAALAAVRRYAAVGRLLWFNHGFVKAQRSGAVLVLSDLRMGAEPDYSFRFAVAAREGGSWKEIPPQQLRWPWEARRRLDAMWRRIWKAPPTSQSRPAARVEAGRAVEP
ncbi:metal-dependent hydrolase [Lysobacter solisilvae (ex Woo and Kim 2020)]|uniref:Metal-dependent hydrolase n=1 Tax=Agrilutibacter terrestris TaxID=2865112 RepID=A0A7H0FUV8_9GAMM|nr:metal-dependent hydrolase [Lysobacter terrestris]QNP39824.1 metal-dependent hydrolase [Lysobacter terrestris]